MPLHAEAAGLIVELLGHVLADACHLAAAARRGAGGVLGLVVDVVAWQMRRQRLPLRGLLLTRRLGGTAELAHLPLQRRQVLVDGLLQQALLLGAEALGGGGELQPLEHRHLVGHLGVDGADVLDLRLLLQGQRAHLGEAHA